MLEEIDNEYRDKRFPPRLLIALSTCLTVTVIALVFSILIAVLSNMYIKYLILMLGVLAEIFLCKIIAPLFDRVILFMFEVVNKVIPINRKSQDYKLFAKTYLDEKLDEGRISIGEYNSCLEELKERVV